VQSVGHETKKASGASPDTYIVWLVLITSYGTPFGLILAACEQAEYHELFFSLMLDTNQ
jgi:hypothetical protein